MKNMQGGEGEEIKNKISKAARLSKYFKVI